MYLEQPLLTGNGTDRVPGPFSERDCEIYIQALKECRALCFEQETGLRTQQAIQNRIIEMASVVQVMHGPAITIRPMDRAELPIFIPARESDEKPLREEFFETTQMPSIPGLFSKITLKLFGPPAAAAALLFIVPWMIAG